MMRSEFIERTGFEPTAKEYAEIEESYNDFDGDKDQFCRFWKKNELTKVAKARLQELELMTETAESYYKTIESQAYTMQMVKDLHKSEIEELKEELRITREARDKIHSRLLEANQKNRELERKMAVLKDAFQILRGE